MKEKLKITINDLDNFMTFAKKNNLKFVKGIENKKIYCNSIYLSDTSSIYLSWNTTTNINTLKFIIKMINTIITSHKLIFEK